MLIPCYRDSTTNWGCMTCLAARYGRSLQPHPSKLARKARKEGGCLRPATVALLSLARLALPGKVFVAKGKRTGLGGQVGIVSTCSVLCSGVGRGRKKGNDLFEWEDSPEVSFWQVKWMRYFRRLRNWASERFLSSHSFHGSRIRPTACCLMMKMTGCEPFLGLLCRIEVIRLHPGNRTQL